MIFFKLPMLSMIQHITSVFQLKCFLRTRKPRCKAYKRMTEVWIGGWYPRSSIFFFFWKKLFLYCILLCFWNVRTHLHISKPIKKENTPFFSPQVYISIRSWRNDLQGFLSLGTSTLLSWEPQKTRQITLKAREVEYCLQSDKVKWKIGYLAALFLYILPVIFIYCAIRT